MTFIESFLNYFEFSINAESSSLTISEIYNEILKLNEFDPIIASALQSYTFSDFVEHTELDSTLISSQDDMFKYAPFSSQPFLKSYNTILNKLPAIKNSTYDYI